SSDDNGEDRRGRIFEREMRIRSVNIMAAAVAEGHGKKRVRDRGLEDDLSSPITTAATTKIHVERFCKYCLCQR
ncbi:hypothetical protein BGZ54_002534, partial [Gamsiella multidivaricata]